MNSSYRRTCSLAPLFLIQYLSSPFLHLELDSLLRPCNQEISVDSDLPIREAEPEDRSLLLYFLLPVRGLHTDHSLRFINHNSFHANHSSVVSINDLDLHSDQLMPYQVFRLYSHSLHLYLVLAEALVNQELLDL